MRIVKNSTVKSNGNDILYSGIILDGLGKDIAIEEVNALIRTVFKGFIIKDDKYPIECAASEAFSTNNFIQAYNLMHCTMKFIGDSAEKLKDTPLRLMHAPASVVVDKVGVYFKITDTGFIPQNFGLHVDINASQNLFAKEHFTKGDDTHITVALNDGASAKDTPKCFQELNGISEISICYNLDPIKLMGTFELVNNLHQIVSYIE